MSKSQSKIPLIIITSLVLSLTVSALSNAEKIERRIVMAIEKKENKKITEKIEEIKENPKIETSAYLDVPFICQAPLETTANWTLHEESCEEAATLQAYLFEMGMKITKEEANQIILDMIKWQEKPENFGTHKDLYAKDMKKFITGYYNLNDSEVKIIENAEIEDIKREVSNGHPVIVPITGEILKNPYYPYPGYHMLTVIGFTEDKIITNDNGTRKGANYSYDIEIFEKAFKDASGDILIFNLNKS